MAKVVLEDAGVAVAAEAAPVNANPIHSVTHFGVGFDIETFPDGTQRLADGPEGRINQHRTQAVRAWLIGRQRVRAWKKVLPYSDAEQAKAASAVSLEIQTELAGLQSLMFNSGKADVRMPGIGIGIFSPRDVMVRFSDTFTSEGDALVKMGYTKTGAFKAA